MHTSIRTKALVLIGVLLLIIFGAITIFQIQSTTKALRENLFEESKAFATLATEPIGNVFAIYKDSGNLRIEQQIDEFLELSHNVVNVVIVDINGEVVFNQEDSPSVEISPEEASTFTPLYKNSPNGVLETIIYPYFEASGARRYSIVYMVSDEEIEQAIRREAMQLLYFGLASMAATITLIYVFINRFILRPVQQVSEQASEISGGNLEQQIQVRGHDEIATLGESVNKMADYLKADIAKLREVDELKTEFMMIASHNLRTPITTISGNLEIIAGLPLDKQAKEMVDTVKASAERLHVLAEDMLTISQIESGAQLARRSESLDLVKLLTSMGDEFQVLTKNKKIKFSNNIPAYGVSIKANSMHLRQAVWNLLDNALKFTKESGRIGMSLTLDGDKAVIKVVDTGAGISASELPKLFTKFHRGTDIVTYNYEGTGIGLYLTKLIVEQYGGTIEVDSQEAKGTTVKLKFPVVKPDKISTTSLIPDNPNSRKI